MLKEILQYQKEDAKLIKLENDLENSQQKKEVNKLVTQVKQAQDKLVHLEKLASNLVVEFEKVKQSFERENQKLTNMKKENFSEYTEEQLRDAEMQIKKQIGSVLGLGKEIKILSNRITNAVKDFDNTKNFGIECKNKYKNSLDQYNKFSANKQAEKEKIEKQLAELSKKIDPKILETYKKMRDDNKFPILVPLVNQSCGGCAMNVPNARYDILSKEGVLECENCHRIIYLTEENK